MDRTNQKRAQYATASALLFHFEDDDLRTENEKLRHALVSVTKNLRKRAEEGRITEDELSGKRPLDFTALHPLSPKILKLLKDCSERLRQMQTICTAVRRENRELKSRLQGPASIADSSEPPRLPSATPAGDDEMVSPTDNMLVDEIDSTIAASESVAAKPGPLPLEPQDPAGTGPPDAGSPSEVVISRISIGVQTGCSCARKEATLTGSELAFIRTRGEPERSKEWLSTMCAATDRAKAISQKDIWLAYRSQCDGGAAFDPSLFFNVLKELFPGARIAKDGDGKGKEQYMVYGLARKKEPCRCGAEL